MYLRIIAAVFFYLILSGVSHAEDKSEYKVWQWKLGADERFRYEYREDFDFNENRKDNGSLFFQRLKLNTTATLTDEYLKEKMKVYLEILDARVGASHIKAQATQKDVLDIHQAYLQFFNILESNVDLQVGRMEVKYGNGRLIAQPSFSNRMRHFDGGIVHYKNKGFFSDVLYLQDVKYDDHNLNSSYDEEFITGIYTGYQEDKMSTLFEFYFLPQIIISSTPDVDRYTVGLRLKGVLPQAVSWEIEFPYQFGTIGPKDIKAHALNVSLSKSWEAIDWKPKLAFEYNHATGDKDPNDNEVNTFNPLYQSTHDPYGLLDFFRWQNMREVALNLTVSPTEKLKISPQVNFFWLESKNDSWYNSSGTVLRTKTSGDRGSHVGNEVSLRAYYEITKNIKSETGYAHFFTGSYVKDTGANNDTNWIYTQMTVKY